MSNTCFCLFLHFYSVVLPHALWETFQNQTLLLLLLDSSVIFPPSSGSLLLFSLITFGSPLHFFSFCFIFLYALSWEPAHLSQGYWPLSGGHANNSRCIFVCVCVCGFSADVFTQMSVDFSLKSTNYVSMFHMLNHGKSYLLSSLLYKWAPDWLLLRNQ